MWRFNKIKDHIYIMHYGYWSVTTTLQLEKSDQSALLAPVLGDFMTS